MLALVQWVLATMIHAYYTMFNFFNLITSSKIFFGFFHRKNLLLLIVSDAIKDGSLYKKPSKDFSSFRSRASELLFEFDTFFGKIKYKLSPK